MPIGQARKLVWHLHGSMAGRWEFLWKFWRCRTWRVRRREFLWKFWRCRTWRVRRREFLWKFWRCRKWHLSIVMSDRSATSAAPPPHPPPRCRFFLLFFVCFGCFSFLLILACFAFLLILAGFSYLVFLACFSYLVFLACFSFLVFLWAEKSERLKFELALRFWTIGYTNHSVQESKARFFFDRFWVNGEIWESFAQVYRKSTR